MSLTKVLLIFTFLVFSVVSISTILWLLNQRSDFTPILAILLLIIHGWIFLKTKAFTKNPFKN
ncbi:MULTISPECIES: hypothetical protein [Spirosoma]|uniref:Uncharacterized protein n=2 Tax=Spirosoma TaxID=107 RepID=A0A6G9ART4_9BACT|nr:MULTISPECIES: hypothetical protein [Spirosoma]QHW00049.1 hypothetical protein GJR95_35765 [Spirosoma endbachense]QIP15202.1 hypothetical protein G8759_22540 [Spirosoma aureum]